MPDTRWIIAIVLAATASVASAQPTEDDKAHALALFADSGQHYKRGEFERAAELLRAAYARYPEPILLYNLARALEGTGDVAGALETYERYLNAAPQIEDRGAIERRIATLKEDLALREAAARALETAPPPRDEGASAGAAIAGGAAATSPTPGASLGAPLPGGGDAHTSPRLLPWVVVGAGVVVMATGGVFGYLANARHDAAVTEPAQAQAARLQDQAQGFATASNVGLIGGGLLVVGGAVWGVIDRRRARGPTVIKTGVRLDVGPTWVGVAWELP